MTSSLFHSATSDGVHIRIRPDRLNRVMVTGLIYRFNFGILPAWEALGIGEWRLSAVSRWRYEGRWRCEIRRGRSIGRRARRRSWIGTVRRGYGIGGVVHIMNV